KFFEQDRSVFRLGGDCGGVGSAVRQRRESVQQVRTVVSPQSLGHGGKRGQRRGHYLRRMLLPALAFEPQSHARGDAAEPTPQRVLAPDRTCPADQDQERGLERVLGVVMVSKNSLAEVEDNPAVPVDEERK